MYKIRGYERKDKERVQQICIATAANELTGNSDLQNALLTVFCNYYIEQEPEHCFVAVDEQDEANPITGFLGKGTIDGLRPYSEKYPAHLHIDIHPDYQG